TKMKYNLYQMNVKINLLSLPYFMLSMIFRVYSPVFFIFLAVIGLTRCTEKSALPPGDPDNGGLFVPEGFEVVVVVDSLPGRARQIAVNDNGDVYVKLRYGSEA